MSVFCVRVLSELARNCYNACSLYVILGCVGHMTTPHVHINPAYAMQYRSHVRTSFAVPARICHNESSKAV